MLSEKNTPENFPLELTWISLGHFLKAMSITNSKIIEYEYKCATYYYNCVKTGQSKWF